MTQALSADEQFFSRLKEAAGELPNNEDTMVAGKNEVQPEKKGKGDCIEAPWGEPGPQEHGRNRPDQFGQAAVDASQIEREQVINNLLEGKSKMDAEEQRLMASNFEHVSSGDFTTHSLHLRPKAKLAGYHPTLSEKVQKTCGRI